MSSIFSVFNGPLQRNRTVLGICIYVVFENLDFYRQKSMESMLARLIRSVWVIYSALLWAVISTCIICRWFRRNVLLLYAWRQNLDFVIFLEEQQICHLCMPFVKSFRFTGCYTCSGLYDLELLTIKASDLYNFKCLKLVAVPIYLKMFYQKFDFLDSYILIKFHCVSPHINYYKIFISNTTEV